MGSICGYRSTARTVQRGSLCVTCRDDGAGVASTPSRRLGLMPKVVRICPTVSNVSLPAFFFFLHVSFFLLFSLFFWGGGFPLSSCPPPLFRPELLIGSRR